MLCFFSLLRKTIFAGGYGLRDCGIDVLQLVLGIFEESSDFGAKLFFLALVYSDLILQQRYFVIEVDKSLFQTILDRSVST